MSKKTDDLKKALENKASEAGDSARQLINEARKHPKTTTAIGIGIGAVAAAVLFTSRKPRKKPSVPKNFKPESD